MQLKVHLGTELTLSISVAACNRHSSSTIVGMDGKAAHSLFGFALFLPGKQTSTSCSMIGSKRSDTGILILNEWWFSAQYAACEV